jgi:hypothetical protein
MAILHSDLRHRDSFLYDVIEPLRPVVDEALLALLEQRTFAAREFFETRQGVCRLMPPLPQALAEMAPRLAKLAAPVVEQVAQRLTRGHGTASTPFTIPTVLTQANRSAGRNGVRTSAPRENCQTKLEAPPACRECGTLLDDKIRQYCDDCLPEIRDEQMTSFSQSGREKLQKLRASGIDPSQAGPAAEKRRAIMKQRRKEELEWDAEHAETEIDQVVFVNEILPRLKGVSLSRISSVTGLSQQYCSLIRRGLKVPHPRHWQSLGSLNSATDNVRARIKTEGTQDVY